MCVTDWPGGGKPLLVFVALWLDDGAGNREWKKMGFPPGKTMNSWWFYHNVMNTLPALPEADKRGLAPPDLFPHK